MILGRGQRRLGERRVVEIPQFGAHAHPRRVLVGGQRPAFRSQPDIQRCRKSLIERRRQRLAAQHRIGMDADTTVGTDIAFDLPFARCGVGHGDQVVAVTAQPFHGTGVIVAGVSLPAGADQNRRIDARRVEQQGIELVDIVIDAKALSIVDGHLVARQNAVENIQEGPQQLFGRVGHRRQPAGGLRDLLEQRQVDVVGERDGMHDDAARGEVRPQLGDDALA